MKLIVAICLLIAIVVIATEFASASARNEWRQFKRQFGKSYATRAEEARRFANFLARREKIARHNEAGQSSHKLGLNHMSDWSAEELARLNGFKRDKQASESFRLASWEEVKRVLALDDSPVPDELDWRQVAGRVTPVKAQGECGSCWAFATTGVLEGQEAKRNVSSSGSMKLLSEQELVDCSHTNFGCQGGDMLSALNDIKSLGGVETSRDYPYTAIGGACKFEKSKAVMSDAGGVLLPGGDEEALKQTVAKYGPVSVAIQATDLLLDYASGVFTDSTCVHGHLNHAVLIVGYGTDPKEGDYWIVKNSWSTIWGDKGYVRFRRGVNMCDIAEDPIVAKF